MASRKRAVSSRQKQLKSERKVGAISSFVAVTSAFIFSSIIGQT
jgi:hypothetical protein